MKLYYFIPPKQLYISEFMESQKCESFPEIFCGIPGGFDTPIVLLPEFLINRVLN